MTSGAERYTYKIEFTIPSNNNERRYEFNFNFDNMKFIKFSIKRIYNFFMTNEPSLVLDTYSESLYMRTKKLRIRISRSEIVAGDDQLLNIFIGFRDGLTKTFPTTNSTHI